jgi:hypothetical protein
MNRRPSYLRPPRRMPLPPPPVPAGTIAPIELAPGIKRHLRPVEYEGSTEWSGRVNEVVGWNKWPMERRVEFLRALVEDTARDPAIAQLAVKIVREAGVPPRDYEGQWKALLGWVQRTIYYTNEPDERLQSPQATLQMGTGDCDDLAILLGALGHSIRLPWRYTLSGRGPSGKVRWREGEGLPPKGVNWSHIYLAVGWPPFRPVIWTSAEPTLDVPLGWDATESEIPKGREDMAGGEADVVGDAALPVLAPTPTTTLQHVKNAAKAIPWGTVAAGVIASVLSFVLVQHVVAPGVKRWKSKRKKR